MALAPNETQNSNGNFAYLKENVRDYGMLMALVAIVVFFLVVVRATIGVDFLSAQNITNLFLQNSYVIIMALGMLLVIVAGHIDLSVGSVAAFVGAISAVMTVNLGLPMLVVVPVCLVAGAIIGALQGYWVAYWRIPSFIVTLAGMLVFRGLTLWLLNGQNVGPFPKAFQSMSTGFIPDLFTMDKPNLTAIIVVVVASVIMAWSGWRARSRDIA
ncbi:MAG: sugar ABC transporter permease, partial [Rhodobacteraceae bacterium]|nr:sugar ABC transporter permease [Paracoccaceae bacterium]